ncbi:hypothetical protein SBF1_3740011 [Candidatus Desulfosporosinus infrequens]|uniref:Uncharacterized protein n=1 Tax=Candidatus Desulfosporosinus infrequens TaxID=2043169 RepID=A0A2U3L531_9FIRM|nr:hypothetical protein SBF1_3740011 [Candidatus Desulfosporosinus infrequens]
MPTAPESCRWLPLSATGNSASATVQGGTDKPLFRPIGGGEVCLEQRKTLEKK